MRDTNDDAPRPPAASPAAQRADATAADDLDPRPVRFVQQRGDACVYWTVVEVDARAVPGAHGARCLVFSREDCIRRVWDYPADWRSLDSAALSALSWHR